MTGALGLAARRGWIMCLNHMPCSNRNRWPGWDSLFVIDFDAVLAGRTMNSVLDRLDFVTVVLGGVFFVINVIPGRSNVLGRFERLLLVSRIGERHIAVFLFAYFGIDIVATINTGTHQHLLTLLWGRGHDRQMIFRK